MKRNKENIYSLYQRQIKDKDTAVCSYIDRVLAQTQSMFEYSGLPDTIPAVELERILQNSGQCIIAPVNGVLYALSGTAGGTPDVYGKPTMFVVANPALELSKEYTINYDCVLVENDTNGNSLLPLIGKYAVMYTDTLISLNHSAIMSRITALISASDDKTKAAADEFLRGILNGEYSVIAETAFLNGIRYQTSNTTNANYIGQLIELIQYIKASLYNDLGLNANWNAKRERLNTSEVLMNIDVLLPYIDNMLNCRKRAMGLVNQMYGTHITVDLNSSWKYESENLERNVINVETETPETETETPETDETPETETETVETETETDKNESDD